MTEFKFPYYTKSNIYCFHHEASAAIYITLCFYFGYFWTKVQKQGMKFVVSQINLIATPSSLLHQDYKSNAYL